MHASASNDSPSLPAASHEPNALVRAISSPATLWTIVAIGVALRLVAWVFRTELWLDEIGIVRNLMERSLREVLTVPLDFAQAAPKGFLLVEWLIGRATGANELALRFIPFAASAGSVFLVRDLVRRLFSRGGAAVTLLLFAVGIPFLNFTADVKQYTLDLALSLLLVREAMDLHQHDFPGREVVRLALIGAAGAWFSQYSVMAMCGLGAVLALLAWRRLGLAAAVRALLPLGLLWGVSALVVVYLARHSLTAATNDYMFWYHSQFLGPRNYKVLSTWNWPWRAWRIQLRLFHGWSIDNPQWLALFPSVAMVGLATLLWRRRGAALLLVAPLLAVLAASAIRQYPQTPRLVLASTTILLFGIGECAEWLTRLRGTVLGWAGTALALLLCVPPVTRLVLRPPPYQKDQLGEALRAIRARWRPGDRVFIPEGLAMNFLYYAPRFGFRPEDYVISPCAFANRVPVFLATDKLRGQPRVWAVVGETQGGFATFEYMAAIGIQRDSTSPPVFGSTSPTSPDLPFGRTTVRLFDLSDSTRLASTTATTYIPAPVTDRKMRDKRWCYGVLDPLFKESHLGPMYSAPVR